MRSRSSGALPSTFESRRSKSRRPTLTRHTLARIVPPRVSICTVTGSPLRSDGRFHRQLVHIRFEIFFLLPAIAVEPLAEIPLAVEQADADQGNPKIGCALEMVTRQDAQPAGIDGKGFVQAEFG